MRQVPGGRWGLTWLVTLILFITSGISLELFVRSRRFVPSVKEDVYSWALERRRASDRSHRTVAILGASRILLAFAPGAFREALPDHRYVMLAYQGSAPIGALRDLAVDPSFRGVAIVDIAEHGFATQNWGHMDALLGAHHRGWRSIGQLSERWLTTKVQSNVALLAGDGLRTLGSLLQRGEWPSPHYTTTYPDRTKFADYDLADADRRRLVQVARLEGHSKDPLDPDLWLAAALAQEVFIALIQARGGKVVYLRMPTCDERWATDEFKWPKREFWDRFSRVTRAVTIHFKDHPELARFQCPDTSHIASKDGPAFTTGLIDVLRRKGVL